MYSTRMKDIFGPDADSGEKRPSGLRKLLRSPAASAAEKAAEIAAQIESEIEVLMDAEIAAEAKPEDGGDAPPAGTPVVQA